MVEYQVKLLASASRDIENIYNYIVNEFQYMETAENIIELFESAVKSLKYMPYRGTERKEGRFAYKGYRQIFVKNFTILYRIDTTRKYVIIVNVRYTPSRF